MTDLYVSELAIYPVKSLAQITLDESRIDRFGLVNDRRWMVVDQNGVFISQRQYAKMCLIQPVFINNKLTLKASGSKDLKVTSVNVNTRHKVVVWQDECNAYDCGDDVADWLSEFLDVKCRLMYFPKDENRLVDQMYAKSTDHTAFSDGFPILLISQASLDDLNSKLEMPVPMSRFRPNLIVSGCPPFAEDDWKTIRIGELLLNVVKPCSRCTIPNIDSTTAERGIEPAKTLSGYRKTNNKIYFGQNVIPNGEGFIQKSMPVEIVQ